MHVLVAAESSLQSSATVRGLSAIPERCDAIFVFPRAENSGGDLIRKGALKFLAPAGEKGAVLRRESLYSSHIVEWRRARDVGALAGLTQPRGRPKRDRQQERITHLE